MKCFLNADYSNGPNKLQEMEVPEPQKQPTNYEIPVLTRVTTNTSLSMKYKDIFNPVLIRASRIKIVGTLGEGTHEKWWS